MRGPPEFPGVFVEVMFWFLDSFFESRFLLSGEGERERRERREGKKNFISLSLSLSLTDLD